MTRRVRLLVAAVALAALAAPVAPAADAVPPPAPERVGGWVFTRVRDTPTVIEGWLDASARSEESAVVMFALAGSGAKRTRDHRFGTGIADWGVDGWPQVNDSRVPRVACPAACANPVGVPLRVYVSSHGRALTSTVYVATHDVDATLTLTSPGWVVRPWRPRWQAVTTATADGTMVSASHVSVGTYRGARLVGGAFGSFAATSLPCHYRGEGSGVLTGGARPRRMSCPHYIGAVDDARRGTTWRVTADVVGIGLATSLLIVVDYPKG